MSETLTKAPDKLKNCLSKGNVIVQFIPDFKNGISDKAHPLYGGLSSNASISIPAPLLTRRIEKIFSEDELEFLAYKLNEDTKANSSFWREHRQDEFGMPTGHFPIFLKKEGMMLKKSDPLDFIKIRILQDSDIVANSPSEIKNKASQYRFVLIEHDQIHKEDLDIMSSKKSAMKLHTKYEKNEDVLRYILKSFNKNVNFSHELPFLQKETWKLVEVDPARFTRIVEDDLIQEKILVDKAVRYRLLTTSNRLYYTASGDSVKLDGEKNDYVGAAKYLASGAGQEMALQFEAQIDQLEKNKK
jgi:hypothetical protein